MGSGLFPDIHGVSQTCDQCTGNGYTITGYSDSTKVDALQTSIDQVVEIVKKDSEYIEKIYEILSK